MGGQQSIQKCNFEDVQQITRSKGVLINTLHDNEQACLIHGTVHSNNETKLMNQLMQSSKEVPIIIYGKHNNDTTVHQKYEQLVQLGFTNVYIYNGGLFEWLCLQDIYGMDEFPTTSPQLDILKFKPTSLIKNDYFITNS